jgi:signal transduction histidine kinase
MLCSNEEFSGQKSQMMNTTKSAPKKPVPQVSDDLENIRNLSNQIMHLALSGLLRIDFLNEASKILMQFSECDSVLMWLKERGKFYRSELQRSPKNSFDFEIMPSIKDKKDKIVPQLRDNSWLERLCRDIFIGKYSFWMGDAEEEKTISDKSIPFILVVPIPVDNENIGLLCLKKKSRNFFTQKDVEFYQGVAQTLGMALGYRRAQVELRERVKELMCLYGIAKIVEQGSLSLREILQGIVKLLPPAWLYPDIASARIILDDQTYATPDYRQDVHKQSAGIHVGGEHRGNIDVSYSQERPELDEGPFLKEERSLIDAVAREIALIIEHTQIEEDKDRLQEQLRHADRLATIGQLSAGVAHELNEPIGSILGFAQLLQKDQDLSDQAKNDIEKIMRASLHAREVIKKLMLFARQMPPQKSRVNLNQIVDESLYFLESRCSKEGIRVIRQLSQDLPDVRADQAQMTQVLVNTVVNAIQAMPEGGQLTVQTMASDKTVSLIVEDTGLGMEENVQRQIFQPFFTTKDVGKGTGLGLAVVYGIVISHGGTIGVDSKVGRGTKIEIRLPILEMPEQKGEV